MRRICISVDVEEDLPGMVPRSTYGVDLGVPKLLDLLDENQVRADFFFLSSIVEARPDLVRQVSEAGHGIGNHGLNHAFLCQKSPRRQEWEVSRSTEILEEIVPKRLRMYRAAGFSADAVSLRILRKTGYDIDSSILPGRHVRRFGIFPLYDHRDAPRDPYYLAPKSSGRGATNLLEVPITENPLRPGAPLGFGAINAFGPARLLAALRAIEMDTIVFLIHPWELLDIRSFYPNIPDGYVRACSSDLAPLQEFFDGARSLANFATLGEVWRDLEGA